jgi:hypothetical protein
MSMRTMRFEGGPVAGVTHTIELSPGQPWKPAIAIANDSAHEYVLVESDGLSSAVYCYVELAAGTRSSS